MKCSVLLQAERRDLVVQVEVDVKPKNQRTLPPNQPKREKKIVKCTTQANVYSFCVHV